MENHSISSYRATKSTKAARMVGLFDKIILRLFHGVIFLGLGAVAFGAVMPSIRV